MLRATREGMSTRQCLLKSCCQAEGRRKVTRIRTMPNRATWGRRFVDCGGYACVGATIGSMLSVVWNVVFGMGDVIMQHILIDKAKRYPTPRPVLAEDSSTYNVERGYWQLKATMEPMVASDMAVHPTTKKYDRETGEDMRGE